MVRLMSELEFAWKLGWRDCSACPLSSTVQSLAPMRPISGSGSDVCVLRRNLQIEKNAISGGQAG
eukprot:6541919-Prymnesium_polylepis.1